MPVKGRTDARCLASEEPLVVRLPLGWKHVRESTKLVHSDFQCRIECLRKRVTNDPGDNAQARGDNRIP